MAKMRTYLSLVLERDCEAWVRYLLKQRFSELEKDQDLLLVEDWVPGV